MAVERGDHAAFGSVLRERLFVLSVLRVTQKTVLPRFHVILSGAKDLFRCLRKRPVEEVGSVASDSVQCERFTP
jgi:hypothetical protein